MSSNTEETAATTTTTTPPIAPAVISPQEELKNKGNEKFADKKYQEAIDIYNKAVKLNPDSEECAAAYSNRCACYFSLERFDDALKSADECVRVRPEWHRGHFRRGCCLEKLGQLPDAIAAYDKAIQLEPRDADSRGGKLRCSSMIRDAELANMSDDERKKQHDEALAKLRAKLMEIPEGKQRQVNADRFMLHGCNSKDFEEVKMALDCGADPNPPPPPMPVKFTALLIAVDRQANDIVELLLEHKADPERSVEFNKTPLIVAALIGNLEAVKLLIQHEANIEAETADNQTRALHLACHNGHTEVAQFLVDLGANINARDRMNATPLTWAVVRGHTECVRLLLEAGADQLNSGPSSKETCLMVAAGSGHRDVTKVLLHKFVGEADEVENALIESVKNNMMDSALELLPFYADLARDRFLPLKTAVVLLEAAVSEHQNAEMVAAILKYVKDPTRAVMTPASSAPDAISAANSAIIQGNESLLKAFLAAKGFDVNSYERDQNQTDHGYSLLHLAARHAQIDIIKFLLREAKANPKVSGNDGLTPLHLAAAAGSIRTVRLFLEAGADINAAADPSARPAKDEDADGNVNQQQTKNASQKSELAVAPGATPLVFAAFGGHYNTVIDLIQSGARVDCKVDGKTVLEVICSFKTLSAAAAASSSAGPASENSVGHHEVVKALLNAGGENNSPFTQEVLKIALDSAVENKHRSIADLIKKKLK